MLSTWIKEVGRILLLQKFSKSNKVDLPLHVLLLALALIVLVSVLVEVLTRIRFLGFWTIFSKVEGTPAIETTVVTILATERSIICPWTRMLLLLWC